MGGKTKLDIETDQLHSAAGKAAQTLAGSVVPPIPPPPPTATSQLDAALALISSSAETMRTGLDATDNTWATKQQAALTESPPVLQQQDTQAAGDYEKSATFPIPGVKPPIGPPDTSSVQPASYMPTPPEGPFGLNDVDDDAWELDEFGLPTPVIPSFGGGGAGAGASNAGPGSVPV